MIKFNKQIQKLKIAVTSDCVLNCAHCNIDKSLNHTIAIEKAEKAARLLMASPGREKRLEIYGGEPFLKFELVKKIVELAGDLQKEYSKKLSISIATNALLLDQEKLEFLKANHINISISISGSQKSHDLNRKFPNGKGSYKKLKKKLKEVFNALDAKDIVALICVDPKNSGVLYSDFLKVASLGFKVINIECVHGFEWSESDFLNLKSNLLKIKKHILAEIEKNNFIYLEPFLEFLHSKGEKDGADCPFSKDLELYPDGSYSFYPYSFISYKKDIAAISIGKAKEGFKKRYKDCRLKSRQCIDCVKNYYFLQGLSSGSFAYSLRTEVLKAVFFDILKLAKTDSRFKLYIKKNLALLENVYGFGAVIMEDNKPLTIFQAIKKFNWPGAGSKVKSYEILLGDVCNAKCSFCCAGLSNGQGEWMPYKEVVARLQRAKKNKAWNISFSGGEATLCPDIIKMLAAAKNLKFPMIQIISNGIKLADYSFAKKLVLAGANEFKISLHGYFSATHDRLVGVPGAFKKGLKAINNLNRLGVKVASNFAINGLNYKELPLFAKFMAENRKLTGFCFMFSFYEGDMLLNKAKLGVSYSEVKPYLLYALKYLKKNKIIIETKMLNNFVPCILEEYSNLISDWGAEYSESLSSIGKQGKPGDTKMPKLYSNRKKKIKVCANCIYKNSCYGIDKQYLKTFGEKEFKAIKKAPEIFPLRPLYP